MAFLRTLGTAIALRLPKTLEGMTSREKIYVNVLIAENEFATADSIRRLVETMGHTTAWACTGPETLRSLSQAPCQLLILSAQLRDADIRQFLPVLRRRHPDMPVVALTCRNSLALEQQVRQMGVIYYLIKPLDPDELGSIVAHVCYKQA